MSLRKPGRGFALLVLFNLVWASAAAADDSVEVAGTVRDESGRPVAGASLTTADGGPSAQSDASGAFRLSLAPGQHKVRVTAAGRAPASIAVDTAAAAPLEITVGPLRLQDDVVVQAIRAESRSPVTKTDIAREDLERLDYGQELPVLLKQTPSMTQYSETGVGAGYAYFYLRGIQQTRVNMTLDGVPLNEAEDSTLYFVDFDGLAGSLDSIQVQRGVGTSSVGSAAFAGSVNFESVALADRRELTALVSAGSFGTYRTALGGQTGHVGSGLAFYGRVLFGGTDGFRDHSGVGQHTVFFGARRQGDRSIFKVFGFSGREQTELAFLAVDKDTLATNLRENPLSPEEKDRFGQDFVQAQWTRMLSPSSTLAFQGYYNGAQGYYRLFADPVEGPLWQYNLDWRFVGAFVTFNHERGGLGLTAGAHANDFESQHSRDVVDGARLYTNHGFKREVSGFAKIHYDRGGLRLFGDAQVRHSSFRYEGDLDIGSVDWTFFNPKLGARYALRPALSVYASLGRTTREPTRSDLFTGEDNPSLVYDLHAVKPERVVDYEAGVEYTGRGLRVQANVYAMELRNEIALTGELSEIGLALRRNVDQSHRRGVELEVRYEPSRALRLTATANASANRIATWNQSFDIYEADGNYSGSLLRTYHDVRPLLTPQFVGNLGADYTPTAGVALGATGRYVSTSQLDNTDDPGLATPSFFDLSAHASLSLTRWVKKGEPRLRLQVNNALGGRQHWPSGYSYLYVTRDETGAEAYQGTPYYYPQATRSVFVNLDVRF